MPLQYLTTAHPPMPPSGMYVIVEGTVAASGGPSRAETLLEGDVFLADSLVDKGFSSPATYQASTSAVVVKIDRAMLRELEAHREEFMAAANDMRIDINELRVLATLGVGGFGRVKMVTHAPTNKNYALKCMYKGLVIAKRQTEHIMNERRLMGMCRHTFLPHLVATFQDKTQIYVLMDLIQGGELFSLVATRGRLYEPEAAFYAANVTCALEYLHARNIAYRDLKPENLMIDEFGYLKVYGAWSGIGLAPHSPQQPPSSAAADLICPPCLATYRTPRTMPSFAGGGLWLCEGRRGPHLHRLRHARVPRTRDHPPRRPHDDRRLVGAGRAAL